uniref:uncharacterized protein LOC120333275 isoform X1 n=1 Tax=Styela clava TaxID=7725 RepID=UPI0019397D00|nr:uncharacterized protein LOC120333275 isoform X1 [Styela clava]
MFNNVEGKLYKKVAITFILVTSLNIILDIVVLGTTGWMIRTVQVYDGQNETTIHYHGGLFRACGPDRCANMNPTRGARTAAAFVIMALFMRCTCIALVILTMLKKIRAYPQSAKLSFISGVFNVIGFGSFVAYLAHTHAFEQGVTFGYSFALACVVAVLSIGNSFILGWELR